jgi:hypothetical protein
MISAQAFPSEGRKKVMDTGSIKKSLLASFWTTRVRAQSEGLGDREPDSSPQQPDRQAVKSLTSEQEEQALIALVERLKASGHRWTAQWVRGAGIATHVVVLDENGQVLRHLSYSDMVETFLTRHNKTDSGFLLRRSA